jgi:pilus assembly protein CpaC
MFRARTACLWGVMLVGITACLLGGVGPSSAADLMERMKGQEIKQVIRLRVGHSKVLRVPFAITRISVADPEVADIVLTSDREIYINGLAPGVTNISLWGKGRFTTATVTVEADVSLLKEKLHQVLPKEKIGVETASDSVVLSGEVSGPVAQQTAIALALPFAGGKKDKVVNVMHVGGIQQVMLEVRVAEIDRTIGNRININFNIQTSSNNNFGISTLDQMTSVTDLIRSFAGTTFTQALASGTSAPNAIAGWKAGSTLWTMFFNILKSNNLGRILAEPNLVTTSGNEASFLAGGEFPVPVPQQFQTITIEWKKFGVGLVFTPTVLDNEKISMKVAPEVSQLDFTTTITFSGLVIPSINTRRMSSLVEVKDGQTFAVAGLLQDLDVNIVNKFPILGDLPILGPLFRSVNFQKKQTELVILVTPHLVRPVTATAARLPTDKWVDPNDFQTYFLGWQQGDRKTNATGAPATDTKLPPKFGNQPVGD